MKQVVFLFFSFAIVLTAGLSSCNQSGNSTAANDKQDVAEIDSLAQQLHYIDSLYNSGSLIHLDSYKLGKLKSIDVSVKSIDVEGVTVQHINLRKEIGNYYYSYWEDARLLPGECQYLIKAIETIKSNLHRETNHEERYAYITKDSIRILATNDGSGAKWTVNLSVNYQKEGAEITISEEELDTFVDLIKQGLVKIDAISK